MYEEIYNIIHLEDILNMAINVYKKVLHQASWSITSYVQYS